jgi:hypothetical protein
MSFIIKYSGQDTAEDRKQALEDTRDWLGDERFEKITADLKQEYPDLGPGQFTLMVSIAGVSGYPVLVWFEHIYGDGAWQERSARAEEDTDA